MSVHDNPHWKEKIAERRRKEDEKRSMKMKLQLSGLSKDGRRRFYAVVYYLAWRSGGHTEDFRKAPVHHVLTILHGFCVVCWLKWRELVGRA